MGKFHDFDAMWGEAFPDEADRPKVRVFGEDVLLPVSVPALLVLRAVRAAEAAESGNATLTADEVYRSACSIYGRERIDKWLENGLGLSQLSDLVNHAIRIYTDAGQEDEGQESEGNAKPPKTGAKKNARS